MNPSSVAMALNKSLSIYLLFSPFCSLVYLTNILIANWVLGVILDVMTQTTMGKKAFELIIDIVHC